MATKVIKISRDAQADFAGDFARFERESGLSIFKSKMSNPARTVLGLMLERLFRFTTINDKSILLEFAKQYSAVIYDDAVLCWNYAELIDWIKRGSTWQNKKRDDVINMARLYPLYNYELKVDNSANKQFRIGNDTQRNDVYEYLTKEFLVNDFSYQDLIVIGQIAKDYSVIRIREKCDSISVPDKHTIPYLSSVLHNDKQKEAALKQGRDKSMDYSAEMVKRYMEEIHAPYIRVPKEKDWVEKLKIEQAMDELDKDDTYAW